MVTWSAVETRRKWEPRRHDYYDGRRRPARGQPLRPGGRAAGELFALVADPHRHGELDGSGTVGDAVVGPSRLSTGDSFGMKMKMFGFPYKITSKVVDVKENRVVEWRHPAGHHWRWEFESLNPNSTQVTETFDYSYGPAVGAAVLRWCGFPKRNGVGIESTLTKLQQRYGSEVEPG